jgi:23S rRNA (uracil1939-C5)-methyltransferase
MKISGRLHAGEDSCSHGKEAGVNPIVSNFEVKVEKLVYGGDGLARLNGRVVFAPFVLPGERVRAETDRQKPGLVQARTLEVLEPSAERVEPRCAVFGRCGGCHYQHAPYEYQLVAKRAILVEELRRLGKIEPPKEISVVSGEPWGYRNRVQLHIENGQIGYWGPRSHNLCATTTCPIASPKTNQAIGVLAEMLHDPRWPRFVQSLEIFTDEERVQLNVHDTERPVARRFFDWCGEKIPGMVIGPLDYGGGFRVSSNSFFQVNRFLVNRLVETALEGAEGDTALDLYAGVGLFTLPLARRFRQLTAVESGGGASRDLRFNVDRAGVSQVRTDTLTVEAFLEKVKRAPDFILVDPPRAGLGKQVTDRLKVLRPRLLTIVACDPATLARDLSSLMAGGYKIQKITLVDLFPQTFHLETVVRLAL